MIVNERVTDFINSMNQEDVDWLFAIETKAREEMVPIIRKETKELLKTLLRENNILKSTMIFIVDFLLNIIRFYINMLPFFRNDVVDFFIRLLYNFLSVPNKVVESVIENIYCIFYLYSVKDFMRTHYICESVLFFKLKEY